jgi:FtsP/CotA-like multicopper oxidase with cupredoxin domain
LSGDKGAQGAPGAEGFPPGSVIPPLYRHAERAILEAMKRRQFLAASAALAVLPLTRPARGLLDGEPRRLELLPGSARLRPAGQPTAIWGYDALVPGPVLRVAQGERLLVEAVNHLPEATTVHWHGLRLPNAMDGVPGLTQEPIQPGGTFRYDFVPPDAGTFWYHPHLNTSAQMGRGLFGALIVEEAQPPPVDRELLWVLADWRLGGDDQVVPDFAEPFDQAHDGRIGPVVTLNEAVPGAVPLTAGERLRLRLVNAAQARIFALDFAGHAPVVVARDGQPCVPHAPDGGLVWLGPGMRADLILDAVGKPGERFEVLDRRNPKTAVPLVALAYEQGPALRESPLDAPLALPPNPLGLPHLATAEDLVLSFAGGMSMAAHGQTASDQTAGAPWTVNGQAMAHAPGSMQHGDPLYRLALGRSYRLELVNDSDWWHPIHLHGMHMRLLGADGQPDPRGLWLDSVLLAPRERARVAVLADNPGLWMLHCHVIQHQEAGMAAVLEVA